MKHAVWLIAAALLMGACAPSTTKTQAPAGNAIRPSEASQQRVRNDPSGRFSSVMHGDLLGGRISTDLGKSLDQVDMLYHNQTVQHALETAKSGTTLSWKNPDTGRYGMVTPLNVKDQGAGVYCREYNHSITVGKKRVESTDTACRRSDGSWSLEG